MKNPLAGAGQNIGLMKKMLQVKKEIEAMRVEVSKNGVDVVVNGEPRIKELKSNGRSDSDIKEAVNEALKNSQEAAARHMQSMGGLGDLLGQ